MRKHPLNKISVIALGISTGGPESLKEVIPRLSRDLPVPILAVQHIPKGFTSFLVKNFNNRSAISVVEARSGQTILPGVMYIAPGNRHMVVLKANGHNIIKIDNSPPENNCKPSVDKLFRSIRKIYGGNVLTVIMTGIGRDGAKEVAELRKEGAYSIVQDEKTSVVWGMPGAIVKSNDADEIVPLSRIADRIMAILKKAGTNFS